jgi:hypothetical protein
MDAANPLATVVHYSNVVGSQSEPEISFTQISLAYTRETGISVRTTSDLDKKGT